MGQWIPRQRWKMHKTLTQKEIVAENVWSQQIRGKLYDAIW